MPNPVPTQVLGEMIDYYRARAAEYDEWWDRLGRYDRGPAANQRWMQERQQVYRAFDDMNLQGHVLELAPGTGTWTHRILQTADQITAVDASPEMLAFNREKIQSHKVRYIESDIFQWQPDRLYDSVVFGFWISHVPTERLGDFLKTIAAALRPKGKIFFIDGLREPSSTAADHVLPDKSEQVMTRSLNDGRAYRIVKNFYPPDELTSRCASAGLSVRIHTTPTYFYYVIGHNQLPK